MKFGVADYGINVWDGGAYDCEMRLAELRGIGYEGTERLECIDASDAMYKAALYRRAGMDFATCLVAGTNIEASLRFTAALGKEYVWLAPGTSLRGAVPMETYLRRANRFVQAAGNFGLKAALHNHLGTMIENQAELDEFMTACPGAFLVLDIAHLFAAGGDLAGTVRKYGDRIAAVHFKDVFIKDASVGLDDWGKRLRFCELGGGNCDEPWEEVVRELKALRYDKWIFVEHDTHLRDPLIDLKVSLDRLKPLFA